MLAPTNAWLVATGRTCSRTSSSAAAETVHKQATMLLAPLLAPPACEGFVSITLCMLCTKPSSLQLPKSVKCLHIFACFCNKYGFMSKLTAAHTLQLLLPETQGNQCFAYCQCPMYSCLDSQYPVQSSMLQMFLNAALCICKNAIGRHKRSVLSTTARASAATHPTPPYPNQPVLSHLCSADNAMSQQPQGTGSLCSLSMHRMYPRQSSAAHALYCSCRLATSVLSTTSQQPQWMGRALCSSWPLLTWATVRLIPAWSGNQTTPTPSPTPPLAPLLPSKLR